MDTKKLKTTIQALRSLPVEQPPRDLHQNIMAALPRRRGVLGRLEYALKRDLSSGTQCSKQVFLPTTPAEWGVSAFIAGIFILSLLAAFIVSLQKVLVVPDLYGILFALSPAMLGSILLIVAGWTQAKNHQGMVNQNIRLGVVCFLFVLSACLGYFFSGQYIVNMISIFMGVSGFIVTCGLVLISRIVASPPKAGRRQRDFFVNRLEAQ